MQTLSLLVVSSGNSEALTATIQSVLAEAKSGVIECIVLTSETDSSQVAPGVEVREHRYRGELAPALRLCASEAVGEMIGVLQAGTRLCRGALQALSDARAETGAALIVGGIVPDLPTGVAKAAQAIDTGAAARSLATLIAVSHS